MWYDIFVQMPVTSQGHVWAGFFIDIQLKTKYEANINRSMFVG